MGNRQKPLLRVLALLLTLAAMLIAARVPISAQTANEDQGVLAGFISRILSTPTSRVTIGAIEGALSSEATIRDIAVADDQGIYLTIDRIRIDWQRTALLQRRIQIDTLEIGQVRLLRRPQPVAGSPYPGPILPELPLSVAVGTFTLAGLTLGEAVIGTMAQLSARGSASLGAPAQGLRAMLAIRRLDAIGTADLSLSYVPEGERLDLILRLSEPEGGIAARLGRIPGLPPVRLDLTGAGTLDDWQARLDFEGGPDIGATGSARIGRTGADRVLDMDLDARIAALLPPVIAPVFTGSTRLNGAVAFAEGGNMSIRGLRLASSLAEMTLGGSVAADGTLDLTAQARAVPNRGNTAAIGEGKLERLTFEGRVKGPFAAPDVSGQLDLAGLATPDFSLASLEARIAATPLATPAGQPPRIRLEASAQAKGARPAHEGLAEALGDEISLAFQGELQGRQSARLDVARLSTPNLSLAYAGRLGADVVEGELIADVTRLNAFSRLAGRSLGGRARLAARLSGNPATPAISADLSGEATAIRLAFPAVERVLGERVKLEGRVRILAEAIAFDGLSLGGSAFRARLDGRASTNDLDIRSALELTDLARLDNRLRGQARADLKLNGPSADPNMRLRLTAPDARAMGRPIAGLALNVEARRAISAPDITATATGTVDRKPLTLDLRATVTGAEEGRGRAWRVDRLAASLGSVTLDGSGALDRDGNATGDASVRAGDLDGLSPLLLRRLGGRLEARLRGDAANAGAGTRQEMVITASGQAIRVDALTFGSIKADARLAGSLYALEGPVSLEISGLTLPAARAQGLPPISVTARGRMERDSATLEASLRGARGIDLTASGTVPLTATGRLDLQARGTLDAALANARLLAPTQRVAGRVALDMRMRGHLSAPDLDGSASLTGGSFTDAAQNIALSGISGQASARGDVVLIERLTASTPGGGSLSMTGRVVASPERGFPADLRIVGRNAQLVDSALARLVANLDLAATGPLATAPRLSGRFDVLNLDVRVPERLGGANAPLPNARHVAPPAQTRARLAQRARAAKGAGRGGAPFRAALDLTINAPGRIFVRGRGLDAELGGSLRLQGTTTDPVANGAFDLRRGRLSILTQRLDFSRGRVTFAGAGLIPELDFLAETRAADVTARVAVTGPANAPDFTFSSSPSLPEDEVLSRLLFARAAAGLSPFQAIQLAQAVAQLSGTGGGDVFEGTRRALGVDDLDINAGAGGPTVGLSRAISSRARIGIRAGARPESTGVGVDIDLTRRLRLRSEVSGDGNASVGIAIEQEY